MRTITARLGLAACLAACTLLSVPAWADPPDHAPAHGWRSKHDRHYVGYRGRQWDDDYGIVEGRCNRDDVGAVMGAVVGGAIGSQVGSRDDRAVAIIVGAILGAVVGHEIGEDLDNADRACVGHALELGRNGVPVRWADPRRRVTWVVTPTATLRRDSRDCRQFRLVQERNGRKRVTNGVACRVGDGEWRFDR